MGLSERWIGLFMASNGLLVVLFEMPVIHIFDKKNYLKLMSLGSFIVGLSFVVLITGIFPILFLTILFFTLGEMISFPFATTLIMNRSSDAMRGRYMAVYGMIFSLSHLISPGFGLSCADHFGFDSLWIICFILLTLVSFLLYKLKNHLV
jgi:predicted MFS family arabinose efflux permease